MALPDSFLQELKARSDLAELASNYTNLKRQGRNYVGLCPFHGEKTPSFHIYGEDNHYYCFGCHAGGDVITFVRSAERLDYLEAVRFLAERAGLQMPETSYDDSYAKLKTRILELNRETAKFYHRCLQQPEGAEGLRYLQSRGLSPQTIRRFGLGFAPASRFALTDYLSGLGYSAEEQYQANVAMQSRRTGKPVDRFVGRVMFPIIDLRGNVVAFGGRILTDAKPKYLNTSDTPVFHKSSGLFAMNYAKNNKEGFLLLVEGYMDVIALHQAGIINAVATLGTALTKEQALLMARYAKEIVVSYDADEAGQRAARRAIGLLRDAGVSVRVLTIQGGKDPDEFLRSHGKDGAVRFRKLLEASANDVEYQIGKLREGKNLALPADQIAYLNQAAEIIANLDNAMERDIYIGRLAEEIKIERSSIALQVDKLRRVRYKTRQKQEFRELQKQLSGLQDPVNPEKFRHLKSANAEEGILAFLLQNQDPQWVQKLQAALPPEQWVTSFHRRLYQMITERLEQGKSCDLTDLAEQLSPEESSAVARMLTKYRETPARPEDVTEWISVILQEQKKLQMEANPDSDEIQSYLQALKAQKK